MINYMKSNYLNKRVKIKGAEFYGKVVREFSSEVLVAVEEVSFCRIDTSDNQLYFNKSEVEIVK